MTDDNESDLDICGIANRISESASGLDELDQDEVMRCEISLTHLRGDDHVGVEAPMAVSSEAVDYIKEHVEGGVNKEMSTDSGVKIGELFVKGDGTIVKAEIEEEYKN